MSLLSTVNVVSLWNGDPVNFGNFLENALKQFRSDARSQWGNKDQGATMVGRNLGTIKRPLIKIIRTWRNIKKR